MLFWLKKLFSRKKNKASIENTRLDNRLDNIEKRLRRSIQGIGMIRFNAFKDCGGNQSFAIALINEMGDGVIISSLYSREKVSMFSKPLKEFKSSHELTGEEKQALKIAKEYAS